MTAAPRKPLFSSNHHFDVLICLGLVLAIFIPYHQVAGHRFVEFDDGLYTYQNTYVIRGLSWETICWSFSNTDAANWHPLTWISYLVDRELFSSHPGAYLMENVAWHALAACLCYLVFFRTTGRRLFGFTVALIFAVHPVNVENVAWASERKTLLDAVFWFIAILAYLRFIATRSRSAYGIVAIAHILGLMCKAMSVTLPGTLVLIHLLYRFYHPDPREEAPSWRWYLRQVIGPVLPLLALSIYFTAITISAQSVAMPGPEYSLDLRVLNSLQSYGRYLAMFFHPTNLAVFYPLFDDAISLHSSLPAILAIAVISIGAILLVHRMPQLLIGWCWYLGTLIPVIGLMQVGSQSHADRYLYTPMLGLAFVFPVLFDELRSIGVRLRRCVVGGSLGVLAASLILATQIQVSYWRDGVILFKHSLGITGDCVTSVMSLAVAYARADSWKELVAFTEAKIAVARNPVNRAKLARYKAFGLFGMSKFEDAIKTAQEAVKWGDPDSYAYWTLAISYYMLGKMDESARYLAKAKEAQNSLNPMLLSDVMREKNIIMLERAFKVQSTSAHGPHPAGTIKPTDVRRAN